MPVTRPPHPSFARRRAPTLGALLLLAAACGGPRDEAPRAAGDAGTATGAPAAAAPGGAVAKPACPETGLWQACSVKERLERAGLAPQPAPDSLVRRAGFAVGGTRWALGKATLDVFLYPSTAARERDTRALDSATAAPPGTARPGLHPPTLILSNNLAAVLQGAGETQAERVELALTAGLPPR